MLYLWRFFDGSQPVRKSNFPSELPVQQSYRLFPCRPDGKWSRAEQGVGRQRCEARCSPGLYHNAPCALESQLVLCHTLIFGFGPRRVEPYQPVEEVVDLRGGAGGGAGGDNLAPIRVFDFGGKGEAAEARQGLHEAAQRVLEGRTKRSEAVL